MNYFARFTAFLAFAIVPITLGVSAEPRADLKDARKDDRYLLQYKFGMGEVLRYRVLHTTNVRTNIDGTTQQVESQSESVKAWKVTDVLPNGEMEFVHVVESVKMTNQTPNGAQNSFDSESDERAPAGFANAARAIGVPLSVIRIAKNGAIVQREQKHPQPPTSEDMPITLVLPEKPVAIGEKWDAVYDVPAKRKNEAKVFVRTRRLCQLRSVKSGVAVIDVDYQILTPVDSYVQSQLVERLTKGEVRFDIEQGRIIAQQHTVDRRILGFAGRTSSMHFLARLQERLLRDEADATSVALSRR